MRYNDDFVLYLMAVVGVAVLLTSDDSTAWIGLIVLIIGVLFGFGLELVAWFIDRAESRSEENKKKGADGD